MSFPHITTGERNPKGSKRLFTVESTLMRVRSLGFVEMSNSNIPIDRFHLRPRLRCTKLILVKVQIVDILSQVIDSSHLVSCASDLRPIY